MIFGVDVGCTESDRATSDIVDISGICGLPGVSPDSSDLLKATIALKYHYR
ncbi:MULTISPECIES: hypothetical protein [unclassified Microcoleus]|uniref:hypothetical protein n=1 Tax=unclassified Microcoleus TaxID=2642155 RepID=UPI002FCFC75E